MADEATRKTMNAWSSTAGFFKKSDKLAKIKVKEQQIATRKKSFGVQYIDLLYSGASPSDLERCVDGCRADIDVIMNEIDGLQGQVAAVDAETDSKIIKKDGPGSHYSGGASNPHVSSDPHDPTL